MANLDTLRTAYGDSDSGGDFAHLSEERWELLACDELSPVDREAAIDHILACPQCAATYKALHILRSEAAAFDPAVSDLDRSPSEKSPSRRGLWGGLGFLAVAATVMMAVILPYLNQQRPNPENGAQVLRSPDALGPATAVSPVDQVVDWDSLTNLMLRWTTNDPALPAVVQILDSDGELIWTSPETTATEISWPNDISGEPGRFYWRVVTTGLGDKKTSSDLVSFEIAGEGVSASLP